VFYAEKKHLIFYAFNLEDKKLNRSAESFQAWGYLQANQGKPESLGIFNLDDASMSRWVLKVNNHLILQHIDALFVTLEPPGGSSVPRGRKLLYAYLNSPPNHP
jgi:anti-sigma-K factor RskA